MSRTLIWSVPGRFTPSELPGLQAWYDASDLNTLFDATTGGSLVVNGGSIAKWEDKSVNARHLIQASGGSRPTRNSTGSSSGKEAVSFIAASSQFLEATDPIGTTDNFTICWYGTVSWGRGLDAFGAGWSIQPGAVVVNFVAYTQFGFGYLGTQIMFLQQGVGLGGYANGISSTTPISAFNLRSSTKGLQIGRAGVASAYSTGTMSEWFIYNRVLNNAELRQAEAYLVSKWNYV
jgi:hypothetical protein